MKNKRGSIEIIFLMIFIIIIIGLFSSLYILNTQINNQVLSVKQDIFYFVQNAIIAFNNKNLAYYNYKIDQELLKNNIEELIKLNYPNGKIKLSQIRYIENNNSIFINISIQVEPLALRGIIGDFNINIKDEIKIKNMEVK